MTQLKGLERTEQSQEPYAFGVEAPRLTDDELLTMAGLAPLIQTELQQAERIYIVAEQYRQAFAEMHLRRLVQDGNEEVKRILGVTGIPEDFYKDEWIPTTGSTEIEGTIDDIKSEFVGVRIQDNVVDRDGYGKANGFLTPVGGGVRLVFVEVDPDPQGFYKLPKKAERLENVKEEAGALAAAMVPKNTGLDFQNHLVNVLHKIGRGDLEWKARRIYIAGGAKGDIVMAIPKGLRGEEKVGYAAKALEAAGREWGKKGAIGWDFDRAAGDKNTTADINGRPLMESLVKGITDGIGERKIIENLPLERATVSGKHEGGLTAREDATGLGTFASLEAYAKYTKPEGKDWLKGKSVFFRGCGSAARRAIIEASRKGMKVKAIAATSDKQDAIGEPPVAKHAIIVSEKGFSEEDARELYELSVNKKGDIADWVKEQHKKKRYDVHIKAHTKDIPSLNKAVGKYWREEKPDVIFESATQMTLTAKSVDDIPKKTIVVEGGNGVTTPEAALKLKKRGIARIPGILANAGGVFASWFEWAQPVLGVDLSGPKETLVIEDEIRKLMDKNIAATLRIIKEAEKSTQKSFVKMDLEMEEAFYTYSIARALAMKNDLAEKNLQQMHGNIYVRRAVEDIADHTGDDGLN